MIFVLFSANILFVLTVCSNAKPMTSDGNRVRYVQIPQQFVAEESHPYEYVINRRDGPQLEETDDDSYEETRPVAVVALPENREQVYQVINNERDLSASASEDLESAAPYAGHGGGGGGHGHSGWLDMGAYSSGKGAFGWYADYPVGGGHGYKR